MPMLVVFVVYTRVEYLFIPPGRVSVCSFLVELSICPCTSAPSPSTSTQTQHSIRTSHAGSSEYVINLYGLRGVFVFLTAAGGHSAFHKISLAQK